MLNELKTIYTMKKVLAILAALMLVAVTGSAQKAAELYAVWNDTTATLNVFYGDNPDSLMNVEEKTIKSNIKKIVFDESVNNYRPTDCSDWFAGCDSLTEIIGLENLNTENVTDMSRMFYNCTKLKSLDVSHFNTEKVVNMSYMFANDDYTYGHCLETLDLSSFDTRNVVDMTGMFKESDVKTIYVSEKWTTQNVKYSDRMFEVCWYICGGKGTHYNYRNEDASYARIDGGEKNPGYFIRKGDFPYIKPYVNIVEYDNIAPIKKRKLPIGKAFAVLKDSTLTLFYNKTKPTDSTLYTIGDYGDDKEKIAYVVFDNSFKNYYPKSCAHWFDGLKNLKEIQGMKEYLNTQYVVYMDYMFSGCERLETIDLSNFKTSRTKYMGALLRGCERLKSVNLSSFNTANVYDMCYMFEDCSSIDTLDLSMFNTAKVKYTNSMFWGCSNLKTIYVSDEWTMEADATQGNYYMFGYCNNLYGGKGSKIRGSRYGGLAYAHIDEGADNPGLLTRKGDCPFDSRTITLFKKPYYILKDSVLTYYYGICYDEENKIFFPDVKLIVFDESFKEYYPKNTDELFTKHSKENYWYTNGNNVVKIVDMEKYLNTDSITDMSEMFKGFWNLEEIDLSGFNTENVTDMSGMFDRCSKLENIDLTPLNTENVTDMSGMFRWCDSLQHINFSNINTSNVTDMSKMFAECRSLENIDLTPLNTGNVTDMSEMFFGCNNLKSIDLSSFNTENVTNMGNLFSDCYSLENIDLKNFNTKKVKNMSFMFSGLPFEYIDLTNIDVENVVSMDGMFMYCTKLKKLDFSGFKTDRIKSMDAMFMGCISLTELDLSVFNTQKVKNMSDLFMLCTNLKTIYVSDGWKTDSVETDYWYYSLDNLFSGCISLVGGNGTVYNPTKTSIDYAKIDGGQSNPGYFTLKGTEKWNQEPYAVLKNGTLRFFYGKKPKKSLDIKGTNPPEWKDNASKIEKVVFDKSFAQYRPVACNEWFAMCSNLTEITGIENLNTENVTDMTGMFFNCSKLRNVDVSGFKTSNVVSMNSMFYGCNNLENIDLSGFDTRSVTNMAFMFYGCEKIEILDCGCFNTGNVKDMNSMFKNCNNLKTLNLKSFNTTRTSSMAHLFSGCKSLKNIDLSSFDFSYNDNLKFRNLAGMFEDCISLEMLDLSKHNVWGHITGMFFGCNNLNDLKLFSLETCKNLAGLFYGCKSLSTIDLSSFKVSDCPENVSYMFAECENLETIYVSDNWEVRYDYFIEEENLQGEVELHHIKEKHNFANMFKNCPNLTGGSGTKWNFKNVSNEQYLRIDVGSESPGYFTKK